MNITSEQSKKIDEVGKKFNLKLILLHGSFAAGSQKLGSDLDIAVLGYDTVDFRTLLAIHGRLADIFGDSRERELDVKSLHRADALFYYQVAKYSQLLYGKAEDYLQFRSYAFQNYFDSRDLFHLEERLVNKFQQYLNGKYLHAG